MMDKKVKMGPYSIGLSKVDKVLFPDQAITKGDLGDYYMNAAEFLLPYARNRPVTMHRYPDGIDGKDFYQKEIPDYFPDWIRTATVKVEGSGKQSQVVCDNAATLLYLVDQGCITPHVWLSRKDKLDYPDRMIFDLDPPGDDFDSVRSASFILKEFLERLELTPYVMTTGSKGVHVVVPLSRRQNYDRVRDLARRIASRLAEEHPDTLTDSMKKSGRRGRLFIDYLRNAYGQTAVLPLAVRARPGAPVATPLDWDELKDKKLNSQTYTIKNIFRRLSRKKDPWEGMMRHARSIEKADEKLDSLD
jgi:bifunctional non-homologous end joining protein LigD